MSIAAQLAQERLARQRAMQQPGQITEYERFQQQIAAEARYQQLVEKFKKQLAKINRELKSTIRELNSIKKQCVVEEASSIVKKVENAIRYISGPNPDPKYILNDFGNFVRYINDIDKVRGICIERIREAQAELLDVDATRRSLLEIFGDDLGPQEAAILRDIEAIETAIDKRILELDAELQQEKFKVKDLIYRYFVVLQERGILHTFNIFELRPKYNALANAYERVFMEPLPVDLEFEMQTAADEEYARRVAAGLA